MGDPSSNDASRRHIARPDANAPPAEPPEKPTLHDIWQAHVASYNAAEAAKAEAEAATTQAPPTDAIGRAQRHDGWTPERQRIFFDAVAEGLSTEQACRIADMSPSSAYAFKKRAAGQAFALGWRAAQLLGRERIADTLLDRAVNGYTETVTRANGDVIERHRFDNRMGMAMLARLDRQAEAADAGSIAANAAARAVAAEFDQYLALLDAPDAIARVERFLAARAAACRPDAPEAPAEASVAATALTDAAAALERADRFIRHGAALPAEIDASDLDPADRAGWTLDQWQRADAARLIAPAGHDDEASPLPPLVAEDEDEDDMPVWCEGEARQWRTSFPPPPGFDGVEKGRYGDRDYSRALTPDELAPVAAEQAAQAALDHSDAAARRDEWFAQCAHDVVALHAELADRLADGEGERAGPAADRALFFTRPDPDDADAATADSLFPPDAPI